MPTRTKILTGDCLDVMRTLPDQSVDAVVTDPPYGLSFMGSTWDHGVPGPEYWKEALRVAKPGAHLLAFGGTKTFHRLACAIEDADWELRDTLLWCYGTGWPKSLDVSKAVDAHELFGGSNTKRLKSTNASRPGEARTRDATNNNGIVGTGRSNQKETRDEPATENGRKFRGYGTALKPAVEPIMLARKPLEGTVAQNAIKWGTGGLNVAECRVSSGRWPANLIHDGSPDVLDCFPQTSSGKGCVKKQSGSNEQGNVGTALGKESRPAGTTIPTYGDAGSAARLFYCAKPSPSERSAGLDVRNTHPTVKPIRLMRYLVRLVCPQNGIVLDPFCGSGTTGVAAVQNGVKFFVGIDMDVGYVEIAKARIRHAHR